MSEYVEKEFSLHRLGDALKRVLTSSQPLARNALEQVPRSIFFETFPVVSIQTHP